MLTAEENDRLTRVGKGTPMGELLRRYWQPFLPASKLLDNPVQKVRLLGEDLVCYKDRSGSLGLIGDRCAHRLVNMVFGIPDEHGLRCPYHGWCYDATGQCTDTPLESPNSRLKERVKLTAYPVQEMGGLLFTYMGPGPAPILPPWDAFVWPHGLRQIGESVLPCNWFQCQENGADPLHGIYLHGHWFQYILDRAGVLGDRTRNESAHRALRTAAQGKGVKEIVSKLDRYGQMKGVVYAKELGAAVDGVRWQSYNVFPIYARAGFQSRYVTNWRIRVPMDDTHTYHLSYQLYAAPPDVEVPVQDVVPWYDIPLFDDKGEVILDYTLAQDTTAFWAQGAITDRTRETLAGSDLALRDFREMMEHQMQLVERGEDPINVFRDPAEVGDRIDLEPSLVDKLEGNLWTGGQGDNNLDLLHKGYYQDESDRYGVITEDVVEMMRRIEQAQLAKR